MALMLDFTSNEYLQRTRSSNPKIIEYRQNRSSVLLNNLQNNKAYFETVGLGSIET